MNLTPKRFFLFFFIAFFAIFAFVGNCEGTSEETKQEEERIWSAENIQLVHLQDSNQHVSDPDSIMEPAMRDTANMYLHKLETECGIQSAFIIVKKIKDQDTYRMAQDVGNKYGVGHQGTRSGLVIVIATEDKKYTIAPGQGLESYLTDALCGEIGRKYIAENMKLYQPNLAVVQTCNVIYNKMKTGKVVLTDPAEEPNSDFWTLVVTIGFFAAIFIILRRMVKNGNFNGGSGGDYGGGSLGGGRFDTDGGFRVPRSSGGSRGGGSFGGGSYGGGTFGGGGASGGW